MSLENIEWQRNILSHEGGSKFYEVMLLIPMKDSDGRFGGKEIDTSKQALFMTRWGKVEARSSGGAYGEGKLLDITKSVAGMRTYVSKTIDNKTSRGYHRDEELSSTINTPELIERFMKRIGMWGMANPNFIKFMNQFDNAFEEMENDEPAIIIPKIEKVRSPLYGSW